MLSILLLLPTTMASSRSSSSSSANYSPYHYDMTVPQFTPDGRLLQVEYAQSACDHSSPLVAAVLTNDLAILACCSRRFHQPQERLVLLPPTRDDSSSGSGAIVLALAGVLADSLSLLQTVQDELWNEHRIFNGQRRPTAARLASMVASKCHQHAFGGGLRVLGSTLLLAGSDDFGAMNNDNNENNHGQLLVLHQTDPSGAVQEIVMDQQHHRITILGGGSDGALLKRRLERDWSGAATAPNDKDQLLLQQRIGGLLQIMVEEHRRSKPNANDDGDKVEVVALEVVLLSASNGAIKLSHEQVQRFLAIAASKQKIS